MSRHRADPPPGDLDVLLRLPSWQLLDVDDDGRLLAGCDVSGTVQLVEIAADGTRTPLTALPGSCTGRYAPGRRAVVVQHDTDGDERAQLSLLRVDREAGPAGLDDLQPLARDPASVHRLLDVVGDHVLLATNRRDPLAFDVVRLDLATGEEVVVHDAGGYVAAGRLAPVGDEVVLTLLSAPANSTQVVVVRAGVDAVPVTAADDHAHHTGVAWLPDGRGLLMSSNHDREHRGVARVEPDGTWTWLVTTTRHDVDVWPDPDGVAMVVAHRIDGGTRLAVHDGAGHRVRDVPLPEDGVADVVWSPSGWHLAVSLRAPTRPGELLRLDLRTGDVEPVAGPLDAWDDAAADDAPVSRAVVAAGLDRLVGPTSHRVPTPDGELVPCLLYRPREADRDPAYDGATVLVLHGGPEAQAQRTYDPVVQGLVAAGLTVAVPNVRGSTGYGKRWYTLDDGRRRLDAVADLLAVRAWLPQVGGDVERVALHGGSYGGYLVLAGLTMQAGSWRAGVDVVGISSLVTFLENTAPYRRAVREREYGSLERDRRFLEAASPMTYLPHLSAPLLVVHGANDPRVPLSESEQIVGSLRERGVESELLVFDDEGHGLARRANRLVAYPAALEFLLTHLAPR